MDVLHVTIADLRAHAEFETKKHGPKCQRHGSDIVLALLDFVDNMHPVVDYACDCRLCQALAKLTVPNDTEAER